MLFWADIDNAPHVLVLQPIIEWLNNNGSQVQITARDYGQTLPLLELLHLPCTVKGRHSGKRMYRKVLSLFGRSLSLLAFAGRRRFAAVFSHGTRAVYLPAKMLGIPLILLTDYEHGALPRFMCKWPSLVLVPEVMPDEVFTRRGIEAAVLRKYPGLKEELYMYNFQPDPAPLEALGLDLQKFTVVIRPPASMAHYHCVESDELFEKVLWYFHRRDDLQVVLLPRTREQELSVRSFLQRNSSPHMRIPGKVPYGPNLIYHSDLVISGGGTMNREAACLEVPVFSIFKGPMGCIDRHLIQEGKLKPLQSTAELEALSCRKIARPDLEGKRQVREKIVDFIGQAIVSVALERGGNRA